MKYMVTIRRDDAHGESVTCAVVGAVDVPALLAELSDVARFAMTTDVRVNEWLAEIAEGDVLTITVESAAASAAKGARAVVEGRTGDDARTELADRLNEAYHELRRLPTGGRGHLADLYLEASDAIRPKGT